MENWRENSDIEMKRLRDSRSRETGSFRSAMISEVSSTMHRDVYWNMQKMPSKTRVRVQIMWKNKRSSTGTCKINERELHSSTGRSMNLQAKCDNGLTLRCHNRNQSKEGWVEAVEWLIGKNLCPQQLV